MDYLKIFVTDKSDITVEYTHVTSYNIRDNCLIIDRVDDTIIIIPMHNIIEIKVKK